MCVRGPQAIPSVKPLSTRGAMFSFFWALSPGLIRKTPTLTRGWVIYDVNTTSWMVVPGNVRHICDSEAKLNRHNRHPTCDQQKFFFETVFLELISKELSGHMDNGIHGRLILPHTDSVCMRNSRRHGGKLTRLHWDRGHADNTYGLWACGSKVYCVSKPRRRPHCR